MVRSHVTAHQARPAVLLLHCGQNIAGEVGLALSSAGAKVTSLDAFSLKNNNILVEENFESLSQLVRHHSCIILAPPCTTFWSAAAKGPLRTAAPPGVYGAANISLADKENVRLETALSLRCAQLIRSASEHGLSWGRHIAAAGGRSSLSALPS